MMSQQQRLAQQQAAAANNNQAGTSPHVAGGAGTPGAASQNRPSSRQSFSGNNSAQNVSANLHIPANKQRAFAATAPGQINPGANNAPGTPGSASGTGNASSPGLSMAPSALNHGTPTSQHQQAMMSNTQRLLNTGYPVQPNRAMMQQSIDLAKVKPEMLISTIDPNMPRQAPMSDQAKRSSEYAGTGGSSSIGGAMFSSQEKAKTLLGQAKWQPTEEGDVELLKMLRKVYEPNMSSGRPSLSRMAQSRIVTSTTLEAMPEALRVMMEETERDLAAENRLKEADPSYPGTRKRRFQELADTVDKGLIIGDDVEMVSVGVFLRLGNEGLCGDGGACTWLWWSGGDGACQRVRVRGNQS